MSILRSSASSLALLFIIAVGVALLPQGTSAQIMKPVPATGCRPVTTEEIKQGFPPGSQRCDQDKKVVSEEDIKAKTYLRGVLCPTDSDNYGGYGPDETINKLDAKFASCAADFIRHAKEELHLPVCIKEGARTVAKQKEYASRPITACQAGAGCEHPRGIAMDVNVATEDQYRQLHAAAPKFGLVFYLGFGDKYHFVSAGEKMKRLPKNPTTKAVVVSAAKIANQNGKLDGCSAGGASPIDLDSLTDPSSAPSSPSGAPGGVGDKLRCSLTGQCYGQQDQNAAALSCAYSGGTWLSSSCQCPQGSYMMGGRCSPQQPPQQPQTPQTPSGSGGSSGSSGTSGSTGENGASDDPALVCGNQAYAPVCGERTDKTTKTYLNRCFLNNEKARFLNEGICGSNAANAISTIAGTTTTTTKPSQPTTTVTLVGGSSTVETIGNLGSQSGNAFTSAPQPGTPSYSNPSVPTSNQPASQQTFTQTGSAEIPIQSSFGGTGSTFGVLQDAVQTLATLLIRVQEVLTPMRYTVNSLSSNEDLIDEEGIYLADPPEEGVEYAD